jgi:hypothetical protein
MHAGATSDIVNSAPDRDNSSVSVAVKVSVAGETIQETDR